MISRIENGETPYTQDTLEALAAALRTTPASLLMRNPKSEEEALWSVWDSARTGERRLMVDLFRTARGKTGTDE